MELVELYHLREKYTKVSFRMIKCMEKDILFGQMDAFMKETGSKTKSLEKVNISGQMDKFMMVNLKMTIVMVGVYFITQTENASKVSGAKVKNTEVVLIFSLTILNTK